MIIEIDEVNLDIESKSELDLPTVGLDRYVNHESSEIIMVAWQVNDGPLEQWDLSEGAPPARLIELLKDPKVIKWAFNAQFERVMLEKLWGIPKQYRSWRCTQALAYMMGFFGTLDAGGNAAGSLTNPLAALIGVRLYAVGFTLDRAAPFGIAAIMSRTIW